MPYLIREPDTSNQRIYELGFGVNKIGREKDNLIAVLDGSLSRHHAEISITGDRIILNDKQSLNGTFVNKKRINRCQLKYGDFIEFGNVVFQLVHTIKPAPPTLLENQASALSIVRRVKPEVTRITRYSSPYPDNLGNSILILQQPDAQQRAMDKLEILLEVSRQLAVPMKPEQLLGKILDLLFKIMRVDRAAILLINETTGHFECKAVKSQPKIPADYTFYSQKIVEFVRDKKDAILSDDAYLDYKSESIVREGIHAAMCVPLKSREAIIGVLYVDNLSLSAIYSDEDLEFLTCLTNQAAIALDNSQLFIKMQAEAVLRNKLEHFFPQAVSRKLREEGKLEIVDTEVTALFSDISGFTQMSSTMKPRQVIEMLNEYFKVMVEEIVFPYEGTLEKYIGDALLAVWGAPYQQADDANRAVRAAIEMQWAVRRLNQEWVKRYQQPLQIHIGLNTGKVAAGNIGSGKLIQYATIGDTTNVTSRICSAAQAGQILISESTVDKLSEPTVPLKKMNPVQVKGKEHPLQLYRVLWGQVKPNP
ncbi:MULTISPECIES: adenylate/guanylate cyclase domain-containing protein [unclassified Coleofasciculus]|uniref:adenylate/guanylate cyclase domain-containing protein n=1 Tax=unclassified Coleofasciculus TaxID=2692782 RepID=UPI00188053DB|nr:MULTISPECIES: adenylate/guanylate cyclase domain-containing protein [unclassified Coleofasciculus]MBE9125198.1 FHA domain-containing protein [Coleofasciculus sp. LEGE 07081]MBE9148775.1 FHA domain-containing protein [Coleofasciculus sp. LEGE 07092]